MNRLIHLEDARDGEHTICRQYIYKAMAVEGRLVADPTAVTCPVCLRIIASASKGAK